MASTTESAPRRVLQQRTVASASALIAGVRARPAGPVFLLYLVIAVLLELPAVRHMNSRCACGWGADPTQYMWSMSWVPYAIGHGLNPFVTTKIWANHPGFDLASVTSVLGLGLVASPVTVLAGPLVAFNLVVIVSLAMNAWFAYRLCLYVSKRQLPSMLGGYLYGFSAYELGQLLGHLHLSVTFAIPAAALLTLRRIDGTIGRWWYVVLTAIVLAAQLLISTEMLFTMTLMGAAAVVCAVLLSRAEVRERILRVVPELIGAYLLMAAVCSPFLYYALKGPAVTVADLPADALGFFIPTWIMHFGGQRFIAVSLPFPGNISEQGTYLGLPVVVILAVFAVQTWWRRSTRVLVAALAVAVIWALGDTLYVDGHRTIWLPWRLLSSHRFFDQVITLRIGLYISLIAAVMVALWLAERGSRPLWRWAIAALAVVALVPKIDGSYPGSQLSLYHAHETVPRFFTSADYRHYLRRDEVVLPFPFSYADGSLNLLWQARTNMYFRMASGYFGYTPPNYATPLMPALLGGPMPRDAASQLRTFIVQHGVWDVILDPLKAPRWPPVLARIGLRAIHVDGILLYRVPPTWRTPAAASA